MTLLKRQAWGTQSCVLAELRTVRVELFGLGGRERSGSFGAVGGGLEELEGPVGPCRPL